MSKLTLEVLPQSRHILLPELVVRVGCRPVAAAVRGLCPPILRLRAAVCWTFFSGTVLSLLRLAFSAAISSLRFSRMARSLWLTLSATISRLGFGGMILPGWRGMAAWLCLAGTVLPSFILGSTILFSIVLLVLWRRRLVLCARGNQNCRNATQGRTYSELYNLWSLRKHVSSPVSGCPRL
ncbi:MAG: hypothetical protein ACR2IV_10845 [Bryobacteraceae bacterium]